MQVLPPKPMLRLILDLRRMSHCDSFGSVDVLARKQTAKGLPFFLTGPVGCPDPRSCTTGPLTCETSARPLAALISWPSHQLGRWSYTYHPKYFVIQSRALTDIPSFLGGRGHNHNAWSPQSVCIFGTHVSRVSWDDNFHQRHGYTTVACRRLRTSLFWLNLFHCHKHYMST